MSDFSIEAASLRKLAKLAKAATPGPWTFTAVREGWPIVSTEVPDRYLAIPKSRDDAEFMAAANPATVLALLDRIEKLEAQIAELKLKPGKGRGQS